MLGGRPVLISDQTPWKDLENWEIGWDLPLDTPSVWQEKISTAAQYNQSEFDDWCINAQKFAQNYIQTSDLKTKYERLFS